MAKPKPAPPTVQLVAVFGKQAKAIETAKGQIESHWGKIKLVSQAFEHKETEYYAAEMGQGLRKQFFVIDGFYDPALLADSKLQSNTWEASISAQAAFSEIRPVNIDPGYITLTKLVLASAKDRAHRIYLRDGIYAEECLYFLDGGWQSRPWTYPDYQRTDFHAFFLQARDYLKQLVASRDVSA
ncbi:MAG: DUF4416 family protein [Planctomycetales bacterium]|nr:DUF4416 family protein [Planctomycetales bacterium]